MRARLLEFEFRHSSFPVFQMAISNYPGFSFGEELVTIGKFPAKLIVTFPCEFLLSRYIFKFRSSFV